MSTTSRMASSPSQIARVVHMRGDALDVAPGRGSRGAVIGALADAVIENRCDTVDRISKTTAAPRGGSFMTVSPAVSLRLPTPPPRPFDERRRLRAMLAP